MTNAFWQLGGWTMLHFLWAGAIVALAGGALRLSCRRAGPAVRYAISLTTLASLAALPIAIAAWLALYSPVSVVFSLREKTPLAEREDYTPTPSQDDSAIYAPAMPQVIDLATVPPPALDEPAKTSSQPLANAWPDRMANPSLSPARPSSPQASLRGRGISAALPSLNSVVPYLPYAWLLGAPLTFALLATGLVGSERLRRRSSVLTAGPAFEACERLRQAMRIARRVSVAACEGLAQPVLVGVLRPLILLPASALSGWTPEELEMVLVHELAHVRRWDNLVNLLQRVVESLLFFHPAMWLVSRQVRRDREECCDAVVVSRTAQPQRYAELLVSIAAVLPRGQAPRLAAASAMADHPLAGRIRRILKLEDEPMWISRRMLVATLAVPAIVATGLFSISIIATSAGADEATVVSNQATDAANDTVDDVGVEDAKSAPPVAASEQSSGESEPRSDLRRELGELLTIIEKSKEALEAAEEELAQLKRARERAVTDIRGEEIFKLVKNWQLKSDPAYQSHVAQFRAIRAQLQNPLAKNDPTLLERLQQLDQDARKDALDRRKAIEDQVRQELDKVDDDEMRQWILQELDGRAADNREHIKSLSDRIINATKGLHELSTTAGDNKPSDDDMTDSAAPNGALIKPDFEAFDLKHARASMVSLNLEEYFGKELKTEGVNRLQFIWDADGNSIVVKNATEEQLATIRDLIELYDQPVARGAEAAEGEGTKAAFPIPTPADPHTATAYLRVKLIPVDSGQPIAPQELERASMDLVALAKSDKVARRAVGVFQKTAPVNRPNGLESLLKDHLQASFPGGGEIMELRLTLASDPSLILQAIVDAFVVETQKLDPAPPFSDLTVEVVQQATTHPSGDDASIVERTSKQSGLLQPGDEVKIEVVGAFPDQPIDGLFVIEPQGTVALGPSYGRATIAGLTLLEAEEAVTEKLKTILADPEVQITVQMTLEEQEATYLYDGKSFDEWRRLWKNELNPERRSEAIAAFAAFARTGYGKVAAKAILDVAGQYDFSVIDQSAEGLLKARIIEVLTGATSRVSEIDWLPVLMEHLSADRQNWEPLAGTLLTQFRLMNAGGVKDPAARELLFELASDPEFESWHQALHLMLLGGSDAPLTAEMERFVEDALTGADRDRALHVLALLEFRRLEELPEQVSLLFAADDFMRRAARGILPNAGADARSELAERLLAVLDDAERSSNHADAVRALGVLLKLDSQSPEELLKRWEGSKTHRQVTDRLSKMISEGPEGLVPMALVAIGMDSKERVDGWLQGSTQPEDLQERVRGARDKIDAEAKRVMLNAEPAGGGGLPGKDGLF